MPLDATIGGANSNSYVTNADADAFFANRVEFATWDAEIDQDLALMTATAEYEMYEAFGERASTTQALQWPRSGVMKRDTMTYYLTTEIPKPLKDATCLRALTLLSPTTGTASGTASSQTLKIGKSVSFETTSETSSSSSSTSSGGISGEIGRMLRGLIKGLSGVPMVRA